MKSETQHIAEVLPDLPLSGPERDAEITRRLQEREDQRLRMNAYAYLKALVGVRGDRYAACSLATFDTPTSAHEHAITKLRGYCDEITQNTVDGTGVFLFGPCGTGKDHLAMGVCRHFIEATAQRATWASGSMLFEQLRDSFDGRKSESEVMSEYRQVPLLWISDPLPVKGELTPYQAEALYRLVDARYNAKRPIIVTANIAPGEADALLGPAIARRLRESTVQVHCNWKAYGR